MAELPTNDDIHVGSVVCIICKNDQKSGKITVGVVEKKLTKSSNHPYGIKVELKNGKIGRVTKVIEQNVSNPAMDTSTTVNETISELDKKILPDIEDTRNEFKEFYQYDEDMSKIPQNTPNRNSIIADKAKIVKKRFVIAICAFGNSRTGGFVYVGINAEGKIVGLDKDMKFGNFSNYADTFANHMRDTIGNYIQNKSFVVGKIKINFTKRHDKTICMIQILPSDDALFLNDGKLSEFYVRGPSPRAEHLTGEDMAAYIVDRFG